MLNVIVTAHGHSVAVKTKPCEDCGSPLKWTTRAADVCGQCRNSRRRAAYRPTGNPHDVPVCSDCGAPAKAKFVGGRWYGKRCEPCGLDALRRKQRLAMANVRRKAGVEPVKGTTIDCALCGRATVRKGIARRYCDDCATELWRKHPQKRINLAVGNAIRASLKSGTKRRRQWQTLVGYSLEEFKVHLEAQFLRGMSWENHGEWHIDHIRPLCSFKFQTPDDPQFREAWALSNLRPLWARDNLRKGGRVELLL